MFYLIAGRLLGVITYFIYFNLFTCEMIEVLNSVFGWFLFEHIFEDYNTTAGRLFMVYEDFRTLITNVLLIGRNLFFIAQFFTPEEFLVINFILIFLIIVFNPPLISNKFKFFLLVVYINLLNSFMLVSLFNILTALVNILVVYFLSLSLISYAFLVYCFVFVKPSGLNYFNFCVKLLCVKFLSFSGIASFYFSVVLLFLSSYATTNDNFIQEFVLKFLLMHLYVQVLFELKCLL